MEEIETIEEANSLLVRFDGQFAQIDFYMSSHSTIVICIENEKKRSEKCYVVFNFTKKLIAHKMGWDACKIRIKQDNSSHILEDLENGLKIEGNMLYIGQEDFGKMKNWYLLSILTV